MLTTGQSDPGAKPSREESTSETREEDVTAATPHFAHKPSADLVLPSVGDLSLEETENCCDLFAPPEDLTFALLYR